MKTKEQIEKITEEEKTQLYPFEQKVKDHIGDLVIDEAWTVVRMLGVIEGDDDNYWIVKCSNRRKIVWQTCVGGFTPLKGKIDPYKYHNMNVCFYMNEPYWEDYDPIRDAIPEEFKTYKYPSNDIRDIVE